MTPIVFCASCRPWPRASAAAEKVWAIRKPRKTLCGFRFRKIHMIASITANAAQKPKTGDSTIGIRTLSTIVAQCTIAPAAIAAPTRPPIRACDDEEGRPKYQVIRFQAIAPSRPARTTTSPAFAGQRRDHVTDGVRDLLAEERADEVHDRGQHQGDARRQRTRRHRGGDGVGGVVEAVGVVEDQGDDDDRDDDRELHDAVRTP